MRAGLVFRGERGRAYQGRRAQWLGSGNTAAPPRIEPGERRSSCDVGWVNGLAAIRSLGRAGIPVLAVDHREPARLPLALCAPGQRAGPGRGRGGIRRERSSGDALGRRDSSSRPTTRRLNALARNKDGWRPLPVPVPGLGVLERSRTSATSSRRRRLGLAIPRDAPSATRSTRPRPRARSATRAREAVGHRPLQAALPPAGLSRARPRPSSTRLRGCRAVRADGAGAHPGRRRRLYARQRTSRADGEVLATFSGRKLRQMPRTIGHRRVGEAVWDAGGRRLGAALLRGLGFHGISQVEFKRDPRDGRLKLMEVNPRLWQWHGARGGLRRRRAADRLLGSDGRAGRAGPMNGAPAQRWSISVMPGRAAGASAAAVRGRRLCADDLQARPRPCGPRHAQGVFR